MNQPRFVLTTVGISTFLNSAENAEWRAALNKETNAVRLSPDLAEKVEALADKALAQMRQDDVKSNRRVSAELNGLYGLYGDQLARSRGDVHFLIGTDTALGHKATEVIRTFLAEKGLVVESYIPSRLSTADSSAFSCGMKDLIYWCQRIIPGYRQNGYRIVFNLTAAFKSLQGYLNIAGMFYADEMVYIFETGTALLSIPRLPLRVDVEALREYRVEMALMAQGHIYPLEQVAGIPEGLLDIDDKEDASLSDWGTLIWSNAQHDLLGDDLLPFPRLQYTDTFRRDFKQANALHRAELQATLAKVSSLLESHSGDTAALKKDGGLQYEVYSGQLTKDHRPIGHLRVSLGQRVSCTAEDGALRLRHYGSEPYVNNNP